MPFPYLAPHESPGKSIRHKDRPEDLVSLGFRLNFPFSYSDREEDRVSCESEVRSRLHTAKIMPSPAIRIFVRFCEQKYKKAYRAEPNF